MDSPYGSSASIPIKDKLTQIDNVNKKIYLEASIPIKDKLTRYYENKKELHNYFIRVNSYKG